MNESLSIDQLMFTIQRSPRRKTIGITIERDGGLVITAPVECSLATIENIARRKQAWIYTKLAQRDEQQYRHQKQYISGEGHFYLGRSYRLLLVDGTPKTTPPVQLYAGRFRLSRYAQVNAEQHFTRWYTHHAYPWLTTRVQHFVELIGIDSPPTINVRDLGYRWGSCHPTGRINFHWRIMQLPPRIIEYVIAHELVHLIEPNHQQPFWDRLNRAMPDYEARKQWLLEYGGAL